MSDTYVSFNAPWSLPSYRIRTVTLTPHGRRDSSSVLAKSWERVFVITKLISDLTIEEIPKTYRHLMSPKSGPVAYFKDRQDAQRVVDALEILDA